MKDLFLENAKVLDHYTLEEQAIVWIEEMSELTKEITKRLRNKEFTDESLAHFKEELTDVQICLDQMRVAIDYNFDEQEDNYRKKVERTKERIKNE